MGRFYNIGIATKLNLAIVFISMIFFGGYLSLLLTQQYKEDLAEGERLAAQLSEKKAMEIEGELHDTKIRLESLAESLLIMKAHQKQDRAVAIEMLTRMLENNEQLLGTYTLWEPNAFDNNDAQHVNASSHDDHTGRLLPYVVRSNDRILIEPLKEYEDGSGLGYYLIPKETKKVSLLDPFYYEVNGEHVLMTSLVVPILDKNNQFLGIVGADLPLNSIQKDFEQIHVLGGYATLISANGTYLANGKYPDNVMKPYQDTSRNQEINRQFANKSMFKVYSMDHESKGEVLRLFYPVTMEGSNDVWFCEIVIPKKEILSNFYIHIERMIVVTCIALLLMCLTIIWLVKRLVLNNIVQIIQASKAIAAGDMTQRLSQHANDEFGQMATYFNEMVMKRKEAEDLVAYHANHDFLTGLPNRNAFHQALILELQKNTGPNAFAVLFIDLDRFKLINDSLDHTMGDYVLKVASERIQESIDYPHLLSRFGGDEFIVLLPELSDPIIAEHVAETILGILSEPIILSGKPFLITASIGIRISEPNMSNAEVLIKDADTAMYVAKKERNTFRLYTPSMNRKPSREAVMEEKLPKAIENGELLLYYQPKIRIRDQRIFGMEALLRWNSPELGMVSPAEFIPFAESSGQIMFIGQWVLETACKQLISWREQGIEGIHVGVNLSIQQFQQKNIHQLIEKTISEHGIPAHLIDLELTESVFMNNPYSTVRSLQALKEYGVLLSLDDFGTGFSSLSYLKNLPLNTLKLDRSFIQNITIDAKELAIVRSVIEIAHSLELEVVTEGVETQEQLSILQKLNCDAVQGYVFYPPLPPTECTELLLSSLDDYRKGDDEG